MNTLMKVAVVSAFVLALGFGIGGYFVDGYLQNLAVELASTSLGLGIGLVVVNVYLQTDEKREAAKPLLEMILPSIREFHNKHFIQAGRDKFGTPDWNALLDAYQENGRRADALSPAQRDGLVDIIRSRRDSVVPLLDTLHDQLRELSVLLGWSFSPKVMRAALSCRLQIVKFKNLTLTDEPDAKRQACKLWMDIDATSSGVVRGFVSLFGLRDEQWLGEPDGD